MTADPARPASAAGTADLTRGPDRAGNPSSAGPTGSAIAEQSRRPAGTAGLSGRPGSAVTAVTPQDPARPAGLARPRAPRWCRCRSAGAPTTPWWAR